MKFSDSSGGVFMFLLGAVAIIGFLGLALHGLLTGPMASVGNILHGNAATMQMARIGNIAILDASLQTSGGDCDVDGFVEPRAYRSTAGGKPTNGGVIPLEMGAELTDPWTSEYGYCVWDVGPTSADVACGGATGRLDGADDPTTGEPQSLLVLAIISAGPDQQFQTTCNAYVDTTTALISTSGDDLVKSYTYAEAKAAPSSPWGDSGGCTLPWGGSVSAGASVIAYQTGSPTPPLSLSFSCVSETRTCADGTLSGSYEYENCVDPEFAISVNRLHGCGVKYDGSASCWGTSHVGAFGDNGASGGNKPTPGLVYGNYLWSEIFVGEFNSCGIQSNGSAWCWGHDNEGELGDDAVFADKNIPTPVIGNDTWKIMSGMGETVCGIKADDSLWCWGSDNYKKLGNGSGSTASQPLPGLVNGGGTWIDVSIGLRMVCGIKTDGNAWCWGDNWSGQLGNNTLPGAGVHEPTAAVMGGHSWKAISAGGDDHVCAIKTDDTAWCWGRSDFGELGNGTDSGSGPPTYGYADVPSAVFGGGTWAVIAAGWFHTCGIKTDGSLWCWGLNSHGQLGRDTGAPNNTADSNVPVAVYGGGSWVAVDAGQYSTCGIKTDGSFWCWGEGDAYRLGTGSMTDQYVPVEITLP